MPGVYEYGSTATLSGDISGYVAVTVVRPDGTDEAVEVTDTEDGWTAEVVVDASGIWTYEATEGEQVETGSFYVRPPVLEAGS